MIEMQRLITQIPVIKIERQYWLVRTMGGKYYNDFKQNGFVAIGYDEVLVKDIQFANSVKGKYILIEMIKKLFPDEKRPKYIVNQLIDFTYSIKKGDIVIMPSTSSKMISIGEVKETLLLDGVDKRKGEYKICPFKKQKQIEWIKTNLSFDNLDPKLLQLKYTRRTITKIDFVGASILDRIMSPLFIKSNEAHLIFNLNIKENINAVELFEIWLDVFQMAEEFGMENDLEIKRTDFDLRINVQSPGTIEFISYSIVGIIVLSLLVSSVIGAELEVDSKIIKFKLKTNGILKEITNFLNNKINRNLKNEIINKFKKLNIDSGQLLKVIEKISND